MQERSSIFEKDGERGKGTGNNEIKFLLMMSGERLNAIMVGINIP